MKNYAAYIGSMTLVIALGFGFSSCKDDDPPTRPKLSLAQPTMTASETDGEIEIELLLDKPHGKDLTVEYTLGGSASDQDAVGTANADYEVVGDHGVTVISAGQTSGVITLNLFDDAVYEADETIEISILDINTSDVEITTEDETVITLTSDDAQLTASFANPTMTVNEADGATGLIQVTVELDKAAPADVTVDYAVKIDFNDETRNDALDSAFAVANEVSSAYIDYAIKGVTVQTTGVTGKLVIPGGSTSANIEIQLFSDFTFEDDETIEITLTPSAQVQPGTNSTIVITLEQQNGKVIALVWEDATYTDVDMDLFLWYSPGADSMFVAALSATDAVQPQLEYVFIPATLTGGRFGLSHNYYAGTADPLNFEVQFADYANGAVEADVDRDVFTATYTLANINPWAESDVLPIVVQTFTIVDGVYTDITQIVVPAENSRVRSLPVPDRLKREPGLFSDTPL